MAREEAGETHAIRGEKLRAAMLYIASARCLQRKPPRKESSRDGERNRKTYNVIWPGNVEMPLA